jgi:predicted amidohydrolase
MSVRPPLTIAAAQPACVPGDLAATARAHADAVRVAGARVVVFPELSLTGYELGADVVSPDDAALDPLVEACAATGALALAGAPVADGDRVHIATLAVTAAGATVVYRKTFLGGDEPERFSPGDGPVAIDVDGRRVGLGICKDTGVGQHVDDTAALDVDVYVAGLVHRPGELPEQDRRGAAIAWACDAHVAFASFAGPTGGGYDRTAGTSTIWSPSGSVLARAGTEPGDLARATIG